MSIAQPHCYKEFVGFLLREEEVIELFPALPSPKKSTPTWAHLYANSTLVIFPAVIQAATLLGRGGAPVETAEIQETQNLTVDELKAAIKSAWKKHEELAKQDLAPLLYWLRDKLRAQGARNDLTQDKDRGFAFWVEEHLDISRRTVDRWCEWYAVEAGLKADSTSGHLSKSDVDQWEDILDTHQNKHQIAFNFWVPKALHAKYQKALTHLQETFGVKDSKEAVVRGVIYAASVINKRGASKGSARLVGHVSLSGSNPNGKSRSNAQSRTRVRARVRATHRARKVGDTR